MMIMLLIGKLGFCLYRFLFSFSATDPTAAIWLPSPQEVLPCSLQILLLIDAPRRRNSQRIRG